MQECNQCAKAKEFATFNGTSKCAGCGAEYSSHTHTYGGSEMKTLTCKGWMQSSGEVLPHKNGSSQARNSGDVDIGSNTHTHTQPGDTQARRVLEQ